MNPIIDDIIRRALEEDMPMIDVTTDNLFEDEMAEGVFIAKQEGVLSGVDVMRRVFQLLDDDVYVKVINGDGAVVEQGDVIAVISGSAKSILKGERVALNLMQRMSGVATLTRRFVDQVVNTHTKILDTRKTTPNLRILEKQAVVHGGGINHRMNLSDQVMIKDNHIQAAGGIANAVSIIKQKVDHSMRVEVEVETFEQYMEAQATACDIIMLDNMSTDLMRRCVEHNQHRKLLEASGNMTLDRIAEVSATGVDFISVGALTHSYTALDISLKFSR